MSFELVFTTRRCFLFSLLWRHEPVAKKVTQSRKGLVTNSVGSATELSLVCKLLQEVIPKNFRTRPQTHRVVCLWSVTWCHVGAHLSHVLQLLLYANKVQIYSSSQFKIEKNKMYGVYRKKKLFLRLNQTMSSKFHCPLITLKNLM